MPTGAETVHVYLVSEGTTVKAFGEPLVGVVLKAVPLQVLVV